MTLLLMLDGSLRLLSISLYEGHSCTVLMSILLNSGLHHEGNDLTEISGCLSD